MRFSGTYFELTDRSVPTQGTTLIVSVAKRIVPSAVRRNTVKRVVRESWRAKRKPEHDNESLGSESSQPERLQQGALGGRIWMLRLKRFPGRPRHVPARLRMKAGAHIRKSSVAGEPLAASPIPDFSAVKRLLRADADRLFQQAMKSVLASTRKGAKGPGPVR